MTYTSNMFSQWLPWFVYIFIISIKVHFQILCWFKVKVKVTQSYPTLWDPMDYIIHGILQARILEWVAIPFSRESSQPRGWTWVSHPAGRLFIVWVTREPLWNVLRCSTSWHLGSLLCVRGSTIHCTLSVLLLWPKKMLRVRTDHRARKPMVRQSLILIRKYR